MLGGRGGCAGPAFSPALFLLGGGGGGSKTSAPRFLVPKGNQPTACTLALWWLKFGPTGEGGGGGRETAGIAQGMWVVAGCGGMWLRNM